MMKAIGFRVWEDGKPASQLFIHRYEAERYIFWPNGSRIENMEIREEEYTKSLPYKREVITLNDTVD